MNIRLVARLLALTLVGCGSSPSETGPQQDAAMDGTVEVGVDDSPVSPDSGNQQDSASAETEAAAVEAGVDSGTLDASLVDAYVAETGMETSIVDSGVPEAGFEASADASEAGQDAGADAGPCGGLCPASQCTYLPPPYESFCNFCNEFGYSAGPESDQWCGSSLPVPAADANLIFQCIGMQNSRVPGVEQELVDGSLTVMCSGGQACHDQEVSGTWYAWCQ